MIFEQALLITIIEDPLRDMPENSGYYLVGNFESTNKVMEMGYYESSSRRFVKAPGTIMKAIPVTCWAPVPFVPVWPGKQ